VTSPIDRFTEAIKAHFNRLILSFKQQYKQSCIGTLGLHKQTNLYNVIMYMEFFIKTSAAKN